MPAKNSNGLINGQDSYSDDFESGDDFDHYNGTRHSSSYSSNTTNTRTNPSIKKSNASGKRNSKVKAQKKLASLTKNDEVIQKYFNEQVVRIKSLQSRLAEMTTRCDELLDENRELRRLNHRQERAIDKYERNQDSMPFILREHSADVRRLRQSLKDDAKSRQDLEKRNKKLSNALNRVQDENKRLVSLVEDRGLIEKADVRDKLAEAESKCSEKDHRIEELERQNELKERNNRHETLRLQKKNRQLALDIELLQEKISTLETKLQEREKELAIQNIYAQRVKPPSRVSSVPMKPIVIDKSVITESEDMLRMLEEENVQLKKQVATLHQLEAEQAETEAKYQEKAEKLEAILADQKRLQAEIIEKSDQMELARIEAEKNLIAEKEAHAAKLLEEERILAEELRLENEKILAEEREEWEKSERRKVEEETKNVKKLSEISVGHVKKEENTNMLSPSEQKKMALLKKLKEAESSDNAVKSESTSSNASSIESVREPKNMGGYRPSGTRNQSNANKLDLDFILSGNSPPPKANTLDLKDILGSSPKSVIARKKQQSLYFERDKTSSSIISEELEELAL